jgi:hypothetical protein
MRIYRYSAELDFGEIQEIVIVAKTATEALAKLKAYLETNGHPALAAKAGESDLELETHDVFQTFGVDG